MKKTLLAVVVSVGSLLGARAATVSDVEYVDADGFVRTCPSATVVASASTSWSAGWYVVNANVTITRRITCNGAVNLILADGCTLTASAGITVSGSNSLTVYGQEAGTGGLSATATTTTSGLAGIGGITGTATKNAGAITINGGVITATGGAYASGIGGGCYLSTSGGTGSNIRINGGTVTATGGSNASGIGSAYNGTASTNICVAGCVALKAGSSASPSTEIAHESTTDVASSLKGLRYVTTTPRTYAASVTGRTKWSNLDWSPALPEGGIDAAAILNVTASGDAAIVFDNKDATIVGKLTVDGACTLEADKGLFVDGCWLRRLASRISGDALTVSTDLPKQYRSALTLADGVLSLRTQNREVISINFAGGKTSTTSLYPVSGTAYVGLAPVQGDTWVNLNAYWNKAATNGLPAIVATLDGSMTTACPALSGWCAAADTWEYTAGVEDAFLKGYLDDGTPGATVSLSGIPYEKYDLIVYMVSDDAAKVLRPLTVNGMTYTYDAANPECAKVGDDEWGVGQGKAAAYGRNALRIRGLTSPTLDLVSTGGGAGSGKTARGAIAALQIVNASKPFVCLTEGEYAACRQLGVRIPDSNTLPEVGNLALYRGSDTQALEQVVYFLRGGALWAWQGVWPITAVRNGDGTVTLDGYWYDEMTDDLVVKNGDAVVATIPPSGSDRYFTETIPAASLPAEVNELTVEGYVVPQTVAIAPHAHALAYSAEGDALLKATCAVCEPPKEVSLTMTAQGVVSGAGAVTVGGLEAWLAVGAGMPALTYEGTDYGPSEVMPTAIGVYLAILTTPDGSAAVTNAFTVREDELELGNFNFKTKTFPLAQGRNGARYRQLSILLTREMTDETVSLPDLAGYALNEKLSTVYSYVIDIDAPGKTSAEIAEYIRQTVFNGCRDQKVRIVLDAQGTAYRTFYFGESRHYYQYVPFEIPNAVGWTNCYKAARNMWYIGRQGYLATVTSQPEDIFIYKASADPETGKGRVGWMGGTSCKHGDADGERYYASFDPEQADKTEDGHWYWACGPERGQEFFDWAMSSSCSTNIYTRNAVTNNYYFNWDSLQSSGQHEPNCTKQSGGYERFLTTLGFGYGYTTDPLSTVPGSKLDSNVYGWNDLKEDGNKGGNAKWDVLGYLVEFGDEMTGDSLEGAYVPGYVTAECLIHAPVVTYDAGEGTFEGGEKTNAVTILDVAEGYVLPDPLPTLDGCRISGWYTNLEDKTTAVMVGSPLWTSADHVVYVKWISATSTPVEISEPGKDPVVVDLPNDVLKERGYDPDDPDLGQRMQTPDANGLPAWVNMVAGLEPDANLATGAVQDDDKERLAVVAANLDVPPPDTGFGVRYYLDHVMPGDGSRIGTEPESESSSPNGLSVDLSKVDTNEYYKVRIVIYQTEGDYTREVVATNTLGVLNVKKAPKKTIVSVPWGQLGVGDADVKIADLIKTANLTPGDRLYAYRIGDAREFPYDAWELGSDYQWTPATLVNVAEDSQATLTAAGDPADETIPRGCACWLERQDATQPFYLYGQVETNATVRSAIQAHASGKPCWNLIGSPCVTPLDLNVQFPDGCDGDQIIVPTDGAPKNYTYQGGKWGYYVTEPYKDGVRSVFKTDDTAVTPGLGVWYINNGRTEKSVAW